jgi:hypothetical protein
VILAVLGFLWAASPGQAQTGYFRPGGAGGLNRPTTSPYLNLTRPGNTALNYYNLVRPEFEFRNAVQGLQTQINQQQQQLGNGQDVGEGGLPVTGHAVQFQNFSHYFPRAGGPGTSLTQGRAGGNRPQTQQAPAPPRGGGAGRR